MTDPIRWRQFEIPCRGTSRYWRYYVLVPGEDLEIRVWVYAARAEVELCAGSIEVHAGAASVQEALDAAAFQLVIEARALAELAEQVFGAKEDQ